MIKIIDKIIALILNLTVLLYTTCKSSYPCYKTSVVREHVLQFKSSLPGITHHIAMIIHNNLTEKLHNLMLQCNYT